MKADILQIYCTVSQTDIALSANTEDHPSLAAEMGLGLYEDLNPSKTTEVRESEHSFHAPAVVEEVQAEPDESRAVAHCLDQFTALGEVDAGSGSEYEQWTPGSSRRCFRLATIEEEVEDESGAEYEQSTPESSCFPLRPTTVEEEVEPDVEHEAEPENRVQLILEPQALKWFDIAALGLSLLILWIDLWILFAAIGEIEDESESEYEQFMHESSRTFPPLPGKEEVEPENRVQLVLVEPLAPKRPIKCMWFNTASILAVGISLLTLWIDLWALFSHIEEVKRIFEAEGLKSTNIEDKEKKDGTAPGRFFVWGAFFIIGGLLLLLLWVLLQQAEMEALYEW
ncbi:hypothetical protein C8F04DRAFT_1268105 [Mycena alexandri]|uniref:Uncharacterized protein n=1 Tax=Mycena alexandri TaxID=1745969 RepID=A0AAD6SEF6_9AGAR|nr:hypothetical protein C8F04DRAFT_1268105 [Mycena alexandri]